MRISADWRDPGYREDCSLYEVKLGGVRLRGCVTADEEQGVAWCYLHDAATGRLVRDEATLRPVVEEIRGRIEIVRPSAGALAAFAEGSRQAAEDVAYLRRFAAGLRVFSGLGKALLDARDREGQGYA